MNNKERLKILNKLKKIGIKVRTDRIMPEDINISSVISQDRNKTVIC